MSTERSELSVDDVPRNELADEPSLYLRQHAGDPVHWLPWGEHAFERARQLGKPVLVSIGYSSCHWCHVMARESFRDPKVAALMNEKFVSVKVDREERPDVDAVYMAAVQALTGHGGWPLTVALTPTGQPFFGGTYFPPEGRHGTPSFTRVLNAVADAWDARRQEVEESAQELTGALKRLELPLGGGQPGAAAELARQVTARLASIEDRPNAGFGGAPKFPPHETVRLLLAHPADENLGLALRCLRAMARGGIRDQLGGGFARYSVDEAWRVPHFEMMLYDNAAMLRNYATAYALTGDEELRQVALGVADWLVRELGFDPGRTDAGKYGGAELGFYSALDADQDGAEGAYYVWTEEELRTVITAAGATDAPLMADLAAAFYDVVTPGLFEGANVLRQAASVTDLAHRFGISEDEAGGHLARAAEALRERRSRRTRPAVDDKALASWNGLALGALAAAGRLMHDERLLGLARANASFLRHHLWQGGRLWHVWSRGARTVEGLLEDYAYVGLGLLDLYRATFDADYLDWALELARQVATRFHDEDGGYFNTAAELRGLVVRPKGYPDAATPSENAAAAELVWWAGRYAGDSGQVAAATEALSGIEPAVVQAPQSFSASLRTLLLLQAEWREVLLVGEPESAELAALADCWRRFDDGAALVLQASSRRDWQARLPLTEGRLPADDEGTAPATAYVCANGACRLPVTDPHGLAEQLKQAGLRRFAAGEERG